MKTYNFIYCTKEDSWEQIEINAKSEGDAWAQLMSLPIAFTYIDLMP